jgi:hypothetical protein
MSAHDFPRPMASIRNRLGRGSSREYVTKVTEQSRVIRVECQKDAIGSRGVALKGLLLSQSRPPPSFSSDLVKRETLNE